VCVFDLKAPGKKRVLTVCDDDDEGKDDNTLGIVVVLFIIFDACVCLCSRGAVEALVALRDDTGGLGARFDEASSAFGVGRFGKLLLARIKTCHWGSYWKTN